MTATHPDALRFLDGDADVLTRFIDAYNARRAREALVQSASTAERLRGASDAAAGQSDASTRVAADTIDRTPLTADEVAHGQRLQERIDAGAYDAESWHALPCGDEAALSADDGRGDDNPPEDAATFAETPAPNTAPDPDVADPFQPTGEDAATVTHAELTWAAALSAGQRKIYRWCVDNRSRITHDMPSLDVIAREVGYSRETVRKVVNPFREWRGLRLYNVDLRRGNK